MCLLFEGLGRAAPDPRATVSLDGVDVPLGKGINTNIEDTSLLYNEYPFVFCIIHFPSSCCLSLVVGQCISQIYLDNYSLSFTVSLNSDFPPGTLCMILLRLT